MSLIRPHEARTARSRGGCSSLLGLFGAALLYGDGMITPAISVLSAVEGLGIATPVVRSTYVEPITIVILIALFLFQRRGTAGRRRDLRSRDAALVRLHRASSASRRSSASRASSRAVNPVARRALLRPTTPGRGFLVLGAVFLVVTGGEALYADMGHFGARPIRIAWFALVLPALAPELLRAGRAAPAGPRRGARTRSTGWCPAWALYPLVVLVDGRDGHRVAGGDLGRVLADAPGGAARATARACASTTPPRARSDRSTSPP